MVHPFFPFSSLAGMHFRVVSSFPGSRDFSDVVSGKKWLGDGIRLFLNSTIGRTTSQAKSHKVAVEKGALRMVVIRKQE
ncbi:MAG: hypothetical protein LAC69_00240 [Chlorobium sp.]|jgi:hypothetical protein|nr:hypothetical protein [Chlorobium sp.]